MPRKTSDPGTIDVMRNGNRRFPEGACRVAVLLLVCATACLADDLQLTLVSPATVQQRLQAGAVSASQRPKVVEQLFGEAGCQVSLPRVNKQASNVICDLPGETSAKVLVGAHLDFVEAGKGIVDDWSGVALLISLYQTLKSGTPKHSYQFIAFSGEERGLLGSSRYVKELDEEQAARTQAFVNLECLGLTPPKVWVHRSAPELVERLREIAAATKISLQEVNVEKIGDDDTHPFLSKKIPVISIHSITQETLHILHSRRDNVDAINPGYYFDAYRLVAFYLKYLDAKLPV